MARRTLPPSTAQPVPIEQPHAAHTVGGAQAICRRTSPGSTFFLVRGDLVMVENSWAAVVTFTWKGPSTGAVPL